MMARMGQGLAPVPPTSLAPNARACATAHRARLVSTAQMETARAFAPTESPARIARSPRRVTVKTEALAMTAALASASQDSWARSARTVAAARTAPCVTMALADRARAPARRTSLARTAPALAVAKMAASAMTARKARARARVQMGFGESAARTPVIAAGNPAMIKRELAGSAPPAATARTARNSATAKTARSAMMERAGPAHAPARMVSSARAARKHAAAKTAPPAMTASMAQEHAPACQGTTAQIAPSSVTAKTALPAMTAPMATVHAHVRQEPLAVIVGRHALVA